MWVRFILPFYCCSVVDDEGMPSANMGFGGYAPYAHIGELVRLHAHEF